MKVVVSLVIEMSRIDMCEYNNEIKEMCYIFFIKVLFDFFGD